MSPSGYVMQIQPFSVNDGNGIRTAVFMAGCPLRCQWCSNPEGFISRKQVGWHRRKCIGCGACASVCPEGIGIDINAERNKCASCGACADACISSSRILMVREMNADDVLAQIQKHQIYYAYSGGGVTFTGGEASMQPEFLYYLSKKLYDRGIDIAIETCGYFDFETVRSSLERMDMIFMDLKHMDNDIHMKYTGVSNHLILDNMKKLSDLRAKKVIRIPVINGVNADEDNIRRSASFVHKNLPDAEIELLPYHRFGSVKYEALGLDYRHPEFSAPDDDHMQRLKAIIAEEKVTLADFR